MAQKTKSSKPWVGNATKLIKKLDAIFERTLSLSAILAIVLFCSIALAIGIQVLTRFFLGVSTGWLLEVSEWSLLWVAFLSAAWVLEREKHVHVDILTNRLGPKKWKWLNAATSIVGAIFCLLFTWYGTEATWDHYQRGAIPYATWLIVPKAALMVIIPIGTFLLFVQFLRRTYRYLKAEKVPTAEEPGLLKSKEI